MCFAPPPPHIRIVGQLISFFLMFMDSVQTLILTELNTSAPPPQAQAPPPPLGHCPCDVIRPPKKLKNTPTLGHSQAPPPLGHCPCDVIHMPRGGGVIGPGHAHCIGFQYQDKFRGGGDHPYHHHPWIRHCPPPPAP